MMVLFSRYVPHTVLPHQGELQRILIIFNLRKDAFPRARSPAAPAVTLSPLSPR
jgi:hypothetical protein